MSSRDHASGGAPRVLVTGAGGIVAAELIPRLARSYGLTLWDRTSVHVGGIESEVVDVTDFDAVRSAMRDFDAVVHLAIASPREHLVRNGKASASSPSAHDAYDAAMMRVNNDGTMHLMKAAARCGVGRFVYMSSLTVVTQGLATGSLSVTQPPVPRDIYACTKLFGEALGRHFAAATAMRVVCLRLGQPYPVSQPDVMREVMNGFANRLAWLVHHDDIATAVRCALDGDLPPFTLANLVSAQAADYFPEAEVRSPELGFVPRRFIGLDGSVLAADRTTA